ncbi:MAG: esterase-like activity of phytase family protein [Gemmataceae bacterium]|nr:esterase-like activity of phytase family protein [Gemmataceae bacterium]MDW8244752.1 esterase-like activity of phytase family protein [Thermogemmata sp.]
MTRHWRCSWRLVWAAIPLFTCQLVGRAEIQLVGVATQPGTETDLSALQGKATDGTPLNRLGGHGSAIAYTGRGNEYLLLSDRGPKDGAVDFPCRIHRVEIRVTANERQLVQLRLLETVLLTDEGGRRLTGALEAIESDRPEKNRRYDPEGLRVGPDGTVYVAEEYGPLVDAFDTKGRRLRCLPVPEAFRPSRLSRNVAEELPPHNHRGRQPNRGFEGLAITPDGQKLYAITQGPLLQDAALDAAGKRIGRNCRILEIDLKNGHNRQFVYPLDDPRHGVSEIVAINDQEFLVLERDGQAGTASRCKKIFHIDLSQASDVSNAEQLPAGELPPNIRPVRKKLFLDLLDPRFGIAGEGCPEKFEGLAFGPDLPDGRHLLLVTVDNDFLPNQPFRVYAFAIDRKDLPGYQPQKFIPPPEK